MKRNKLIIGLVTVALCLAAGATFAGRAERAHWFGPLDAARLQGDLGSAVNLASATNLSAASLTPGSVATAIDGGAITNVDAANIAAGSTASAIDGGAITNVDAANIAAGSTASAFDGGAITNVSAANLAAGSVFPACDASGLTNMPTAVYETDDTDLISEGYFDVLSTTQLVFITPGMTNVIDDDILHN